MAKKSQTGSDIKIHSDERILSAIKSFYGPCKDDFLQYTMYWDKFDNYVQGKQWSEKAPKKTPLARYIKDDGNPNTGATTAIWNLPRVKGEFGTTRKQKLPKRTINEIITTVESANAMISSLSPTPIYFPPNAHDDNQREAARVINIFFSYIFNSNSQRLFKRMNKEMQILGQGFYYLHKDGNSDKGHIPFFLDKDNARTIFADHNVDDWSKVKWVIRQYPKYQFEIAREFKIEDPEVKEFDLIDMEEIWIRQDVLYADGKPNNWEMFTRRKGKEEILKRTGRKFVTTTSGNVTEEVDVDTSFPVLPIECFRMMEHQNKWYGISEVQHMIEAQDIINKRASQEDFVLGYNTMPAVTVDPSAEGKVKGDMNHIFMYPNEHYTWQPGSRNTPVTPIPSPPVNITEFHTSMDQARGDISRVSGVTDTMRGLNPKGVYGGGHWREIQDAGMTKIKNKFTLIEQAFHNLVTKIVTWAIEDLQDREYYEVYDSVEGKQIKITVDDFENVSKFHVKIDTSDAKLLSVGEQLNKLNEIAQYNDAVDGRELLLSASRVIPGLLDNDYVDYLDRAVTDSRSLEKEKAKLEKLGIELETMKVQQEIKAMKDAEKAQKETEKQGQSQPDQNTPTGEGGQPPASPVTEEEIMGQIPPDELQAGAPPGMEDIGELQQFVEMLVEKGAEQGIPEEAARADIEQRIAAIQRQNPGLDDTQIIELIIQSTNQ